MRSPRRLKKIRAIHAQPKQKTHIARKLFHLANGLLAALCYGFLLNRTEALWILGGLCVTLIPFDLFRLRSSKLRRISYDYFSLIMRKEERERLSGATFYLLGLLVIVIFFQKPIVLLGTLYLAIGDPVSSYIGTKFGRHPLPFSQKTWEGTTANFMASFLISLASTHWLKPSSSVLFSCVGGLISVSAEVLPISVDDNLTIPLVSCLLLSGLNNLWPFLS